MKVTQNYADQLQTALNARLGSNYKVELIDSENITVRAYSNVFTGHALRIIESYSFVFNKSAVDPYGNQIWFFHENFEDGC